MLPVVFLTQRRRVAEILSSSCPPVLHAKKSLRTLRLCVSALKIQKHFRFPAWGTEKQTNKTNKTKQKKGKQKCLQQMTTSRT